ncbi:MAG: AraC family transcriptional regulator [Caldilinea sp. CFX5]|nr:AraC family transcriptional regulator [Caldilinea sp. CFX5]
MPKKVQLDEVEPMPQRNQRFAAAPMPFPAYTKQPFVKHLTQLQLNAWDGVILAHVHLEPNPEMMNVILQPDTIFNMQIGGVVDVERVCDGHFAKVRACQGSLTLIPDHISIASRWNAPVQHFYCLLPQALWSHLAAEHMKRDPTKITLAPSLDFRDPLSEHILCALQQELASGNAGGRLYAESLVQTLILHTLVHGSSLGAMHPLPDGHGLTPAQMRQVQEFIAENYERDLGLAELAATLNFSPTYFAHQFKHSFGMPPHQYLTKVRVEQAKRLLEQGGMTVGDIAAQVGFYDQSHLAHHFKRLYRVTPKVYLQQSSGISHKARSS